MASFLPVGPMLGAFLAASVVLAVTPGPGVIYIVTRAAAHGRTAGLVSVAGVALGNMGSAVAASLGVAAIFAVSVEAFVAVKYLGAAYLIYLGIRAIRSNVPRHLAATMVSPRQTRWRIFLDGFVVALFNPKTSLFFAAFLPQFLPSRATSAHIAALGGVFVMIAAMTDTCYAVSAGVVGTRFVRGGIIKDFGRYVSGGVLIGLGILAALTGRRVRT